MNHNIAPNLNQELQKYLQSIITTKKRQIRKLSQEKKLRITGILRVPVDFDLAMKNSENELKQIDYDATGLVETAQNNDEVLEFLEDYMKTKLSLFQHRISSLNSWLYVLAYVCGILVVFFISKFPLISSIPAVTGFLAILFKAVHDQDIFKNIINYEYLLLVITRARKKLKQIKEDEKESN